MKCPSCGRDGSDDDTFCSKCGYPLRPGANFSQLFDAGKIVALESIKTDILAWFQRWGVAAGLLLAVGTWVGLGSLIDNKVGSAIEDRLKRQDEVIHQAVLRAAAAAGRVEVSEEQLSAKLKALTAALENAEATKVGLARSHDALQADIGQLRKQKAQVAGILQETAFVVALHKLRDDLYRLHDLRVRATVYFSEDAMEALGRRRDLFALQVALGHLVDGSRMVSTAEFSMATEVGRRPISIGDWGTSTRVMLVEMPLLQPFTERLYGHEIATLQSVRFLHLSSPHYAGKGVAGAALADIRRIWLGLERVELRVVVNGYQTATLRLSDLKFREVKTPPLEGESAESIAFFTDDVDVGSQLSKTVSAYEQAIVSGTSKEEQK